MRSWQRLTVVVLVVVTTASARNALRAQVPVASRAAASWTVMRDPFVDLWYHCLAVIGYEGYGPLPLYDARYAATVRAEKRRGGTATTLDARAGELRAVFAGDSAFEILHFVPLYFVGREPSLALAELRRAVTSTSPGAIAPARLIAAALATPRERAYFLALIDAAQEEWTVFVRDRLASRAADERAAQELQTSWADRFATPLAAYLAGTSLTRGTIIVSPAIGGEGRIVRGAAGYTTIAVSSDRSDVADAPLLAAVHELVFPLLDELRAPLIPPTTRVAAARARDAAAVRAGALVLDAADARLAAEYRQHFLRLTTARSFDDGFSLDWRAESELRALIAAMVRAVATGRSLYENP